MTAGRGICAEIEGRRLYLGSEKFLAEYGVFADGAVQSALERFRMQGKASVLISDEERCIGVLALSDVLRPDVKDMAERLADMRTWTLLLTGDSKR